MAAMIAGIIILAMSIALLAGCGRNAAQTPETQTNAAQNAGSNSGDVQGTDTDGDGVNDKQDNQPTFAENPIKEAGTADLPIAIKDARVEDNATGDHLEISITNTGKDDLTNLDIYYTVTDKVANKSEAYYAKLDGLSIKAGETQTIHFDNDVSKPGHYYGNMNGLYGTSANGLTFDVTLHGAGCKPYVFTVEKAKGTAEVAD